MFQFLIEWEDEARVRDRLLRATWARLEVHASEGPRKFCLTDCVGERSHSLRRGVYGSVFPLARWAVENWWFILNESPRTERFWGGRAHSAQPGLQPWIRRHNLLAARSGFALPDLTIYRDGGHVAVRCAPDPPNMDSTYPVRFVAEADLRLPLSDIERSLRSLIESVGERVREQPPAESVEASEFLADWEAVKDSARTEPELCATAAAMGLDTYDPEELTDSLVDLIEGPFKEFTPALRCDLAESSSGPTLKSDFEWTRAALNALDETQTTRAAPEKGLEGKSVWAHRAGYERARWFRETFGLPAVVKDLEGFVSDRCGWDPNPAQITATDGVAERINAAVGSESGRPRLTVPLLPGHSANQRFLLGRGLFFVPQAGRSAGPRLISRASSWPQRASRAFAAELLAPAAELARLISTPVNYEQAGALARLFGVSEMVIEHQLQNHHIAELVDL